MKAIRVHQFGDPAVLKLEDTPDPQAGPGQVVVRMLAIGVNPVETYIRAGRYGQRQFPYTPGSDGAGTIEATGSAVKRVTVGDRVYVAGSVSGTYAQLALCDESSVHPLPAHLSFAQGAALGVPAATAYRALFHRGAAQAGETLLVHGATGGVGLMAVQLARAAGLQVIGTGGSPEGRELIKREGAHHALDHFGTYYLQEIMQLTEGRGVDLILEMLANVNLAKDLSVLAKRGRVVVVGSRGKIEIDPRETMSRDADIRGMTLFNTSDQDRHSIHSALVAALESRTLHPVIDQELPLADAAKAHQEVMEGNSRGKIVLIP
jgi:NADPH2:quinone reductase